MGGEFNGDNLVVGAIPNNELPMLMPTIKTKFNNAVGELR